MARNYGSTEKGSMSLWPVGLLLGVAALVVLSKKDGVA
jgi:hypothetical protein